MKYPKVSIPITCFNQEEFIKDAVLSAVDQDYDNLQVIVCDDASTDNSGIILSDLEKKFPNRLKVHTNVMNLGAEMNRNKSLSLSNGKYVTYLDGDDIFLPGKIKKQVDLMENNQECELSYHNVLVFDNYSNNDIFEWKDRFGSGDGNINDFVQRGNYLCSLSTMFLKDLIPYNGFISSLSGGSDWYFFVQLLNNGNSKFCYIDEILAKYRRHSSNITLNWEKKISSQFITIDMIQKEYPKLKEDAIVRKSELLIIHSILRLRNREFFGGISLLFKSIVLVFPNIFKLFRLPIREILFLIRQKGIKDPLLESLLTPKKSNI